MPPQKRRSKGNQLDVTHSPGMPGKEIPMKSTLRSTTMWNSRPIPITKEKLNPPVSLRPHPRPTVLRAIRRQFDPLTIGFLVGGVTFAMGGCIFGVYLPYHNPVGVNISMLWWSIFLGIVGAYVGACVGQFFGIWEDRAASPSPSAHACEHCCQVQATPEAAAGGKPVFNTEFSEGLLDAEDFVLAESCRIRRWLVHFRSGSEWYAVGEFLALNGHNAIERAIEVLGEGAGYRAEEIPWEAAPLCRVKIAAGH
jgi:hypothetical protein